MNGVVVILFLKTTSQNHKQMDSVNGDRRTYHSAKQLFGGFEEEIFKEFAISIGKSF
jgi:hypothetical protein